jgi:hypothetical protein
MSVRRAILKIPIMLIVTLSSPNRPGRGVLSTHVLSRNPDALDHHDFRGPGNPALVVVDLLHDKIHRDGAD